jgi:hypothetical protein
LNVLLGDIRVRCARGHRRVRINFRGSNAAGLRLSTVRQKDTG